MMGVYSAIDWASDRRGSLVETTAAHSTATTNVRIPWLWIRFMTPPPLEGLREGPLYSSQEATMSSTAAGSITSSLRCPGSESNQRHEERVIFVPAAACHACPRSS